MANKPTIYQIRIGSQLNEHWQVWFDQMTFSQADNGDTLLTGPVADQAVLHGLLRKVRDLGLPLIAVVQVQPDEPDAAQ
ncbi:MAG: hypothetical protein KDE09_11405 [Anaerolineales bacterium]|nr:hypothetical protein [Anaerolineales bacterium]MCB8960190.1 hypothetical protein [Ardenticatenales bacterium]